MSTPVISKGRSPRSSGQRLPHPASKTLIGPDSPRVANTCRTNNDTSLFLCFQGDRLSSNFSFITLPMPVHLPSIELATRDYTAREDFSEPGRSSRRSVPHYASALNSALDVEDSPRKAW